MCNPDTQYIMYFVNIFHCKQKHVFKGDSASLGGSTIAGQLLVYLTGTSFESRPFLFALLRPGSLTLTRNLCVKTMVTRAVQL